VNLYLVSVTFYRQRGSVHDNQHCTGLWEATSREEALGVAISKLQPDFPEHRLEPSQSVTDITQAVRDFVRRYPI
jgi:hypothetical protein